MTIFCFVLIILASWLKFSTEFMYILYFFIGFFVSSMLLSFTVAKAHYDEILYGSIFALVNMVIGICGFLFQFLLSHLLKDKLDYTQSFLCLLLPLLLSLGCCWYAVRKRVHE